jgi:hypothetical protein
MVPLWFIGCLVCACVIFLMVLGWLLQQGNQPKAAARNTLDAMELQKLHYQAGVLLAEHLNKRFAKDTLAVLRFPEKSSSTGQANSAKGFFDTIDTESLELRVATLPPPESAKTSIAFFSPGRAEFEKHLMQHQDATAIVSLCGLPRNPKGLTYWSIDTAAPLALLHAPAHELKPFFQSHQIIAAVVSHGKKPPSKANLKESSGYDYLGWLLITDRNVEKIAKEHRNLFAMPTN